MAVTLSSAANPGKNRTIDGWTSLVNLARLYGWVPQGCLSSENLTEKQDPGNYSSGAMTESDARGFAAALGRKRVVERNSELYMWTGDPRDAWDEPMEYIVEILVAGGVVVFA